jgi:8-oxo-dGTP pyrophosphatase MutT (NUDIX family)
VTETSSAPVQAAVVIPVYREQAGDLRLVLVVRGERGVHGGQLALPGGKREPDDATLLDTALREAEEEIGLSRSEAELMAELPPVATRTTGFEITPFLVRVTSRPDRWQPRRGEIADVVEPRVADLVDPAARSEEIQQFPTWPEPRRTPFVRVGPHRLWGVTYRILEPLLPGLLAGQWPVLSADHWSPWPEA